ncbi:MAG: ACP S-malonyltransferase [Candidatus Gastranaerophilales bacterium]|nr:ACP S-malonyltransferase [Candidatus Gastranaerophilales bacterium]
MKKLAVIFPGQGAQAIGMGLDIFNNSPAAKNVFKTANKVLGRNISDICFEGPEDALKQTFNTQPAILAVEIAALEALKEKTSLNIEYTAGHSLGEYAAIYASGSIDLENAFKLIQKRAELMDKAATSTKGTMTAVLGLNKEKVEPVLNELNTSGVVSVANFNSPEQIVITGEIDAVNEASTALKEAGARRVIPLAVSGAFHSPLMKDAAMEFATFVKSCEINNSNFPVLTNVDAKETTNKNDFLEKMPKQIYSSVYWTQTIQEMVKNGVDTIIEVGPGKVLAGLNKKIDSSITTYNIYDMPSLEATIEALNMAAV